MNYVNAPLVAAERGIEVERGAPARLARLHEPRRVTVATTARAAVAGTTIGRETRTGSSSALGFELEIELAPLIVFFRYDDVPGVIGRVGTLFGEAGVNIANMAVSRTRQGGKALMALSIDSPAPPELVERLRAGASTTPGSSTSAGRGLAAGVEFALCAVTFVAAAYLPPRRPDWRATTLATASSSCAARDGRAGEEARQLAHCVPAASGEPTRSRARSARATRRHPVYGAGRLASSLRRSRALVAPLRNNELRPADRVESRVGHFVCRTSSRQRRVV